MIDFIILIIIIIILIHSTKETFISKTAAIPIVPVSIPPMSNGVIPIAPVSIPPMPNGAIPIPPVSIPPMPNGPMPTTSIPAVQMRKMRKKMRKIRNKMRKTRTEVLSTLKLNDTAASSCGGKINNTNDVCSNVYTLDPDMPEENPDNPEKSIDAIINKLNSNSKCNDSIVIKNLYFKQDDNIKFLYTYQGQNPVPNENLLSIKVITYSNVITNMKNKKDDNKTIILLKNKRNHFIHIVQKTNLEQFINYLNTPINNEFLNASIMENIRNLEYVNIKLSSLKQDGKTTPLYIVTNYDSCLPPNEKQDNIIFLNFTLLNDYPQLDDNDSGLNNFYIFQQQNPIITFCSKNIVTNVINNINRILDFDLVLNDDGVPKINTLSNEYTQPKLVFDPLNGCRSLKQTSCALKLKKKDERSCTSQESHDTIGRQAKRCGNKEFEKIFGKTTYKISNEACGKFEMCGLGKDDWAKGIISCKYKDSIGFKLLTVTAILAILGTGILEEMEFITPETATFIGNLLNVAVFPLPPCTSDKDINLDGELDCAVSSTEFLGFI